MLKTMDNKIALLVIYNHRYDKNIPRINQVYANRFSYVYHIVPFYDGDLENVIPVYDNSFQFQGYISQAYQHLKGKGFTHFVCVADDMVINPQLNEHNFFELSGIDEDACFVHELRDLRDVHRRWFHIGNAIRFSIFNRGLEIDSILPSREEALKAFQRHNIPTRLVPEWPYQSLRRRVKETLLRCRRVLWYRIIQRIYFSYPLVGGYSDLIVVPNTVMPKFCQYCGAFAAARLFVEIAIPTSMILCCDKVQTVQQIRLKNSLLLPRNKDRDFLPPLNHSYSQLISAFPEDMLYIHPIKLSQWK